MVLVEGLLRSGGKVLERVVSQEGWSLIRVVFHQSVTEIPCAACFCDGLFLFNRRREGQEEEEERERDVRR